MRNLLVYSGLAMLRVVVLLLTIALGHGWAGENLIHNGGFEKMKPDKTVPAGWYFTSRNEQAMAKITVVSSGARTGKYCLRLVSKSFKTPVFSSTALLANVYFNGKKKGLYIARCWVKASKKSRLTLRFIANQGSRERLYWTPGGFLVKPGGWQQLEISMPEFSGRGCLQVGFVNEMKSKQKGDVLVDDVEVVRYTRPPVEAVQVSSTKNARIVAGQVMALLNPAQGTWQLTGIEGSKQIPCGILAPSPAKAVARCVQRKDQETTYLDAFDAAGNRLYSLGALPQGVLVFRAGTIKKVAVRDCDLRYAVIPSFLGTDLVYDPVAMPNQDKVFLPSLRWCVGFAGNENLVMSTAWSSSQQKVNLQLAGTGAKRVIKTMNLDCEKGTFFLSLMFNPRLWHRVSLNSEWLERFIDADWQRPFLAYWLGSLPLKDVGGRYTFAFFDGRRKTFGGAIPSVYSWPVYFENNGAAFLHFEKSFPPAGDALFYFLENPCANLLAPADMLRLALGEKEADKRLQLKTQIHQQLGYAVCGSTQRITNLVRQGKEVEERKKVKIFTKRIFTFIKNIRARDEDYIAFFKKINAECTVLRQQDSACGELAKSLANIAQEALLENSQKAKIYRRPPTEIQALCDQILSILKIKQADNMKRYIPVRDHCRRIAGTQDGLCRSFSIYTMRIQQMAALRGSESAPGAILARKIIEDTWRLLANPGVEEAKRSNN